MKELVEGALARHGFEAHSAFAELGLPYPDRAQFDALAQDIAANGIEDVPLRDSEGRIVDGRVRVAILLLMGTKPEDIPFETVEDSSEAAIKLLIVQKNVHRRQMTPSQLALTVAFMMLGGMPIYGDGFKAFGISQESVARATRVAKSGNQAVIDAVHDGAMSVSHADRVISDRVPIEAEDTEATDAPSTAPTADTPAMACEAFSEETLKGEEAPKSRGRPSGNAKVNAAKRAVKMAVALAADVDEVTTYWRITDEECAQVKEAIAVFEKFVAKAHRRASKGDEVGDTPNVH